MLRPGRVGPLPGDEGPAFHLGMYDGEALVGTGNVRLEPAPWAPDPGLPDGPSWRLRGMATAPDRRGQGVGTAVLAALIDHCRAHGGALLWCNARTPARTLYERAGLAQVGDPWDDPEIGPHIRMWMRLD